MSSFTEEVLRFQIMSLDDVLNHIVKDPKIQLISNVI